MMHQIPSRMEVIGMCLGIFGTIIVSTGDTIAKTVLGCFKNSDHKENIYEEDEGVYNKL